jgi:hypothetical protein
MNNHMLLVLATGRDNGFRGLYPFDDLLIFTYVEYTSYKSIYIEVNVNMVYRQMYGINIQHR